ncbi:MAG TPA: ATP-binding cassette domain-containing protein [Candidatus Treponema faecavium]|nr:ATP-binding cassette domain-containing protein [Candidatus Treponema faecavium]
MALEARHLFFRYDKKKPWILTDCSISIERGERAAVLAPSGYGKTTLAMLLAGYIKPDSGVILADGVPLPKTGRCPVQLIHQHPEQAVNPRWKLRYVLEECGADYGDMLAVCGIGPAWLERFPHELSGGELQRFCVARALLCGAAYLICDEISTMLDAVTQAQIWTAVLTEAEKRGMGMLIITHNRHIAQRTAPRIINLAE